jgi:hypothetical protein
VSSEEHQSNRREQIGAHLSPKLLALLAESYPLRSHLPATSDTPTETGVKIGERNVLDFLQSCYEDATQQKVL